MKGLKEAEQVRSSNPIRGCVVHAISEYPLNTLRVFAAGIQRVFAETGRRLDARSPLSS
jgi:hypothetical protein